MDAAPDIAGFADAQKRLRAAFGEPVEFVQAAVATYPAGTKLDRETGLPMDPLVQPTSVDEVSNVVNCNIAFRSDSRGDSATSDEFGWHDVERLRFIADPADKAKIDGAVLARCRGQQYKIVSTTPDGIGGIQRYLVEAHRL